MLRTSCPLLAAVALGTLALWMPSPPAVDAQASPALVAPAVPGFASPPAVQETDVAAFLPAFRQAWASGEVSQVLPLFAPEAVVAFNHREPGGPLEYRGGAEEPMPLRDGVAALMHGAARPDLATALAAPAIFGEAPATAVRWAYERPSLVDGVPPEVGDDQLILRNGRLLLYTRTPDGSNEAARLLALSRSMGSKAAQTVRAADRTGAEGARGAPDTQQRGSPAVGPWALAAGVSLLAVILLATLKHPDEREG